MAVTVTGNSIALTAAGDSWPERVYLKGIRLVTNADLVPTAAQETNLRTVSASGPDILNVELSTAHSTAFFDFSHGRDFDGVYCAALQTNVTVYLDIL